MSNHTLTKNDFMRCIQNTVDGVAKKAIAAWQVHASKYLTGDDLPYLEDLLFKKYMLLQTLTTLPDYTTASCILGIHPGDALSLLHDSVFAKAQDEAIKAGEEFLRIANPIYPWGDVNEYQIAAREAAGKNWTILP